MSRLEEDGERIRYTLYNELFREWRCSASVSKCDKNWKQKFGILEFEGYITIKLSY